MRGCPICAVRLWWRPCFTCRQRRCRAQHTMKEHMDAVMRYATESYGDSDGTTYRMTTTARP